MAEHKQNGENGDVFADSSGGTGLPQPRMDDRELAVCSWLGRSAEALAGNYQTVLALLHFPAFPGWTNAVCYLARDVLDQTYDIATHDPDPGVKRTKRKEALERYKQLVGALASVWPKEQELHVIDLDNRDAILVPKDAKTALNALLEFQRELDAAEGRSLSFAKWIYTDFGGADEARAAVLAKELNGLRQWFASKGHGYEPKTKTPSRQDVRAKVDAMTELLHPFAARRAEVVRRLRTDLDDANAKPFSPPDASHVAEIASLCLAPDFEAELFAALENPLWLEPLDDRGVFAIPNWVTGQYLVRVARDEPRRVTAILKRWTTNHQGVVGQMFEAALAMPADDAASIADHLANLLMSNQFDWLLEDAGKLVKHLLSGGRDKRARTMLRCVWSRAWVAKSANRAHETMYYYTTSMREHVIPVFLEHDPRFLLYRLCEFVDQERDAHGLRDRDDPSLIDIVRERIWERPEYHAYEAFQDVVDLLVEAANLAIRQELITLADVVGLLRTYARGLHGKGAVLYERLCLWLAAFDGAADSDLAAGFLKHPRYLIRAAYLPEYGQLVEMRFHLLTEAEQTRWIRRVVSGPKRLPPHLDTTERRERARARWTLERLYFARQYLDDGASAHYERLQREHDIDPAPRPLHFEGHDLHVRGPYTTVQLIEMGWPAAVHATRHWEPAESADIFHEPSYDGLDEAFREFVQADPQEAAAHAEDLVGAPPWMLAAYFSALQDARRRGASIDLEGPLTLASHAAAQAAERVSLESVRISRELNSWEWAARATAWFVERAPRSKVGDRIEELGFELRKVLWRAIEALAGVRAVSSLSEDPKRSDRRRSDYLTLMFNDTAGITLRSARAYAEWALTGIGVDLSKGPAPSEGLDALPEVRSLLAACLSTEPRVAASHAAIGEAVRLLAWLDANWTKANVPAIFPIASTIESDSDAAGWAAWSVFVFMNRGDPVFWSLFEGTYRAAMKVAVTFEEPARGREDWAPRLGLHLIDLVGSGTIGLDADSPALAFLRNARPWLRIAVMSHLAEIMGNTKERIRPAYLARYQGLWEAYWSEHGKADAQKADASSLFGPWFVSDQGDPDWALAQLRSLVEASVYPRLDRRIAEKLARLADERCEAVAQIAIAMVRNTSHAYEILGWREHAEHIVEKGLVGNDAAKAAASDLRELLIRRGFGGWFDLGSVDSPPA
ncbi:MAG: hypothetical protein RIE77_13080 [Phycisphaerales bacterium]